MFSPTVAMRRVSSSPTLWPAPGYGAARRASTSSPVDKAIFAACSTKPWNSSLRATKSVSALTSTMAATLSALATPISPSAATRPDFLAAAERPFLRNQSMAASTSPLFSLRAFLQSIMPAPVFSRRSRTIAAVISAMAICLLVALALARSADGAPFVDGVRRAEPLPAPARHRIPSLAGDGRRRCGRRSRAGQPARLPSSRLF